VAAAAACDDARVAWPHGIQALDEQILASARGAPAALVPLFHVATVIGGGWGLVAILPFAIRAATRTPALWLLAAIVVNSALVSSLKALFGRVRPCDALAWCAPIAVSSPGGWSFPSGHSAGSFVFASFIAARAPKYAPLALAWALVVGWSRCVLGVHYPSDVLAGALLGTAVGFGFARVSARREERADVVS
jgi:undecaprenyl-diphosphatase